MVFVKVRETYDLHTTQNKLTAIAVHTPDPNLLKRSYPGLLMQCKAYRPYSCDVKIACASVLPLDPQGVGLAEGDVAPEDVFNPILYKACSNFGMSQLEARLNILQYDAYATLEVNGDSAAVEIDSVTSKVDEFGVYYGLLSNTRDWKHANPQTGLTMKGLRPYVHELLYNVGDNTTQYGNAPYYAAPNAAGTASSSSPACFVGNSKPMPFINCTAYSYNPDVSGTSAAAGFVEATNNVANASLTVPYVKTMVAAIIVPPSRLHQLFYRMVVEWTIEFSTIRPLGDITDWTGLERIGNSTHYQSYNYSSTKAALTGSEDSILENDVAMVSTNADIKKVM